jgi:protein involved in polysaccharide export with SLBB domain
MSRSVPVRPDGKISLPLLNDVQAGGLTALELREVLTKKFASVALVGLVMLVGLAYVVARGNQRLVSLLARGGS